MDGVELVDQIELMALFLHPKERVADVFDHLLDVRTLGVDACALVNAREERRLPVRRAPRRDIPRTQRNEPRHVFVLRAQAVKHPGAQAGPGHPQRAGVQKNRRQVVRRNVGGHRADDGQLVDVFANP